MIEPRGDPEVSLVATRAWRDGLAGWHGPGGMPLFDWGDILMAFELEMEGTSRAVASDGYSCCGVHGNAHVARKEYACGP